MKKISLALLVLIPFFLFSQHEKGSEMCFQKKINSHFSPVLKNSFQINHSFDVLHYDLDLDIYNCYLPPYPKSFTASNTITLRMDSVVDFINLDAVNSSIEIDSIYPLNYTFSHQNNILTIHFNQMQAIGDTLTLKLFYKHKNVNDNAFYVTNGRLFTDCEPEGARKWFPCWDKPSDKATMELKAKVPSNVLLGSNGRLQDSLKIADTIWYHWVSRDPVPTYLMVITSRVDYLLDIVYWYPQELPGDSVPMRFYYHPGENVNNVKNIITQMADFFSEIFTLHPFEKNGFATVDTLFNWGGMENQTLTTLCKNCWGEMLAVHEFAHQWFGDMITCATWSDLWINEGFATYSEALWLEHTRNYAAYKNDLRENANTYLSQNPGWAISNPDWSINTPNVNVLFNYSITYMKAACVLHMLRYVVGDDDFFVILKSFANDPRYKYKAASIPDFFAKVEEITQTNYDWFMNQWIYEPNHPIYSVNANFSETNPNTYVVDVQLSQSQTNTVFFQMPVNINITFDDLSDTTIQVLNSVNNESWQFEFFKRPTNLVIDKNNDILLKWVNYNITNISEVNRLVEEVNIFPNPTNSGFYINFYNSSSENATITMLDIAGKKIKQEMFKLQMGQNKIYYEAEKIAKGFYFVTIEISGYMVTEPIVIQ